MSEKLNYEEITTPSHEAVTAIGRIECHWGNTTLMRFEDPYENYIRYNDGEQLHQLNILPDDWRTLEELEFPWEYWPDMSQFSENYKIRVHYGDKEYNFRPSNTVLCLFKQSESDHVEHRPQPGVVRGMTVVPDLKRRLFEDNYPIRWLPYVDRATRELFERMKA